MVDGAVDRAAREARIPLIAGNWKMNGSSAAADALIGSIVDGVVGSSAEVVVMPPFPYLERVAGRIAGSEVRLGAQDVSECADGAYTGDVSATMLGDVGAAYVLVGHSERRSLHGETDEIVAAKFVAASQAGLVPVLCLGETREEREQERTEEVVGRQLDAVIERAGIAAFGRAVVAYEPVWAIGTGLVASPEQAQAVHAFLRSRLGALDGTIAGQIRILYGGSMKPANAAELLACDDIDGGLIGGASLTAADFVSIIDAA
jgi:triosephosphate isomerase